MRNSTIIRYRNKDKSSNSLSEPSVFLSSSSFTVITFALPFQPSTHLHFNFPVCLALLLFYLCPSFSFLFCTFFSLVDKNKHIHLKEFKNYFLTTATTQSTFLWAFCIFYCLFHFYAIIFKLFRSLISPITIIM